MNHESLFVLKPFNNPEKNYCESCKLNSTKTTVLILLCATNHPHFLHLVIDSLAWQPPKSIQFIKIQIQLEQYTEFHPVSCSHKGTYIHDEAHVYVGKQLFIFHLRKQQNEIQQACWLKKEGKKCISKSQRLTYERMIFCVGCWFC